MKEFYYVADWGSYKYLHAQNILISAASAWLARRGKFMKWRISPSVEKVFLDSGGFSFFSKKGDYPFTPTQYIQYANDMIDQGIPLHLVAILDYPCEPTVHRSDTLATNQQKIQATVSNAVMLMDSDPHLPWIPVLQGYSLREYEYCYDLYNEAGIRADYWAVGSVCTRKKTGGMRNIVVNMKRLLRAKIHTFGLSIRFLRDPQIWHSIHSSDSRAWGFMSFRDKGGDFVRYSRKIANLFDSHDDQDRLPF